MLAEQLEACKPAEGETGIAAALKKMPSLADAMTKFYSMWDPLVEKTTVDVNESDEGKVPLSGSNGVLKMACRRRHNLLKGKSEWSGISDEQRTAIEKTYAANGLTLPT